MTEISNEEWGKIYAKAWRDPKFRELLEQDPTAAIRQYGHEIRKTFTKIVKIEAPPYDLSEPDLEDKHKFPPACC
jgi:hypothetical protein